MHTPEGRAGCGSNRPGHDPHWIQVTRVAPHRPHLVVEDLRVAGATGVRLRVDGRWQWFGNHRADRVLDAWQRRTGTAWWVPAARLLRIECEDGHPCFDLASSSRLEPCVAAAAAQERLVAEFTGIVRDMVAGEGRSDA